MHKPTHTYQTNPSNPWETYKLLKMHKVLPIDPQKKTDILKKALLHILADDNISPTLTYLDELIEFDKDLKKVGTGEGYSNRLSVYLVEQARYQISPGTLTREEFIQRFFEGKSISEKSPISPGYSGRDKPSSAFAAYVKSK